MSVFIPGQRWISESEPELGRATIRQVTNDRVQVEFKAAGETRTYAVDQAPLQRVRFRIGDKVRTQQDEEFIVQEVIEHQGLLIYVGATQRLSETQLSDRVNVQGPQERLLAGRFDASAAFELRRRTLELRHRMRANLLAAECSDLYREVCLQRVTQLRGNREAVVVVIDVRVVAVHRG